MTTDPKAPLPDEVEKALSVLEAYCAPLGTSHHTRLRAHIAALTAELEIYRRNDAGGYYSNRKDRETD